MKKFFLTLLSIVSIFLLLSCEQQTPPVTSEEQSRMELESLGVSLSVPEEYMVIWRNGDQVLEIVQRDTPQNRMVIKRTEPYVLQEELSRQEAGFANGAVRPDYLSSSIGGFTIHHEKDRYRFDYSGLYEGFPVEGRQWIVYTEGFPVTVFAEARQEEAAILRELEKIYMDMDFSFPDNDVARFRRKLSTTPKSMEAFLNLAKELEQNPPSYSTKTWDMILWDLSDFGKYVMNDTTPDQWQEDMAKYGIYLGEENLYYQPFVLFQNYRDHITQTFAEATDLMVEKTHALSVDDIDGLENDETWWNYIQGYGELEKILKEGKFTGYLQYLMQDTLRKAHMHFALDIKNPYEARVAYMEYMQNFTKSDYFELMQELFALPADTEDYDTERHKIYQKHLENNPYEKLLMEDGRL